MAGIGSVLTQKIGPFPGYVWALVVGGAVFFLGPKLLGSKSASSGTTASGFDPQSFQAGWAQGVAYQPGGSNQSPNPVPDNLPPQPAPIPPVKYAPGQNPGGISDFNVRHGVGGDSGRSASVSSRSADPHAYFHPLMKVAPRYAHFAQGGVGGSAPAHAIAVHGAAHTAGVHPARLQALNPKPHKFIRIA